MIIISLCSRVFDPDGDMVINIDPSSQYGDTVRRVNRVKTLDGGVSINDTGFAEGDRELKIKAQLSVSQVEQVNRLQQLYPLLSISTTVGVFEGTINQISESPPVTNINFLVRARLDG